MERQPYRPGLWVTVSLLVPAYSVGFMRSNRTGPKQAVDLQDNQRNGDLGNKIFFPRLCFCPLSDGLQVLACGYKPHG